MHNFAYLLAEPPTWQIATTLNYAYGLIFDFLYPSRENCRCMYATYSSITVIYTEAADYHLSSEFLQFKNSVHCTCTMSLTNSRVPLFFVNRQPWVLSSDVS